MNKTSQVLTLGDRCGSAGFQQSPGISPPWGILLFAMAVWLATVWTAVADPVYAWTNFIGQPGGFGNVDGWRSAARFSSPTGVAVDSARNVYIADYNNHTIRKMTPSGEVTLLAGKAGESGFANGPGSAARFKSPFAIAVDIAGNLYVADAGNATIRKVTPSGMVTTLAGSPGQLGEADGPGTVARFQSPEGLAVDSAGNIYVADAGNHTLRKVTASGVVTTLAGKSGEPGFADGQGGAARFSFPAGVAVDSLNNVYVADTANHIIRKITPAGQVTTLAGSPGVPGDDDGQGGAAKFNSPFGLAVDNAYNIYVADSRNHTIRKLTPDGEVTKLAGSRGVPGDNDGQGSAAKFNYPFGVAVDSFKNVFVADSSNHTIRGVSAYGFVSKWAGQAERSGFYDRFIGERFNLPSGVALDSANNVYVADRNNCTIRKVTPAGVVTTLAGNGPAGSQDGQGRMALFSYASGIAVDRVGNVYVADFGNRTIRKVTPAGVVTTPAGSPGLIGSQDGQGSSARFQLPDAIAVDSANNLYVADTGNHTIRKVTPDGQVTTVAGSPGVAGDNDGQGSAAKFNYPSGVAVDSANNVYVADTGNSTIRKITPTGQVTTLAGSPRQDGSADGQGSAARFSGPVRLAVDSANNIYVPDSGNSTIRKITPTGQVTTLAGSPGQYGSADGNGSDARFYGPTGVAVDRVNNVYVADTLNHTIRKITPAGQVTTLAGKAGEAGSADQLLSRARFNNPYGVSVNWDGIYIADTGNHTIRHATWEGVVTTRAGHPGQAGGLNDANGLWFNFPTSVAAYDASTFVVSDAGNHSLRWVLGSTVADNQGNILAWDSTDMTQMPSVAVDGTQNIYVAAAKSEIIWKLGPLPSPGWLPREMSGRLNQIGSADGPAASARFNTPNGVAVDTAGNLYVADSNNHTIRRVASDGAATTLAGSPGQAGFADGVKETARFNFPTGVAVDDQLNVFVADSGNHTIRRITPDGIVTTVGGAPGQIGSAEGIGLAAQFNTPWSVAVDNRGNLYVADVNNNRIAKGLRISSAALAAASAVGGFKAEYFLNLPGGTLADLTNSTVTKFWYHQPDLVEFTPQFETRRDFADDYGGRLSGWLIPPVTGNYKFYIASDDQGALFLSPTANPADKVQIALEPEWNAYRDFITGVLNQGSRGDPPKNISADQFLQAGRPYYIEALLKEAGGGDNLSVAWLPPGGPAVTNGAAPIWGKYLASGAPYSGSFAPLDPALCLTNSDQVCVSFGRLLDRASALNPANYKVNDITPAGVALAPDQRGVLLSIPGLSGPTFSVTVGTVLDAFYNTCPDPTAFNGRMLPQSQADIGDPAAPGTAFAMSSSDRGGDFDVLAGGSDIWGTSDAFHFVYEQLTGDFDVRVRVESIEAVNRWSRGGLMVRESLSANSRNLMALVEATGPTQDGQDGGQGQNVYYAQFRAETNGPTGSWMLPTAPAAAPLYPNAWIRLARVGNSFTAYRGTDGNNWIAIGQTNQTYPANVFVGLATTSHNDSPGSTTLVRYRSYGPGNLRPVAAPQNLATARNTPLPIQLIGSDAEGAVVTYSIATAPAHGVLSGAPPNLIYTPAPDYNGPDSFTFTVNDGAKDSVPATVSIEVAPGNYSPVSTGFGATTPQNQPLSITFASLLAPVSDPEGSVVQLVSVGATSINGALLVSNNVTDVIYTPPAGFIGADRFDYVVSDSLGAMSTLPAQIAVLAPGTTVNTVQALVVTASTVSFNFTGLPGRTYVVQRAESLASPWITVGTLIIQPDGSGNYADPSPPKDAAFYRTILVP